MSLRKRRGELRGDTLGDVTSLGGSSSSRMCSLKVRMQGSGSGALSSFEDMLLDVDDGQFLVQFSLFVVLAESFFCSVMSCRLIFSPVNKLPSNTALSLLVSGSGAILCVCAECY